MAPTTRNEGSLAALQEEVFFLKKELYGDELEDYPQLQTSVLIRLDSLERRFSDMANQNLQLQIELSDIKVKYKKLQARCINIEAQSRRDNLIFDGLPERANENCAKTVRNVMKTNMKMKDADKMRFVRCHRLGRFSAQAKKPRPIIVRFDWYGDRTATWDKRQSLKETGIHLSEDFPVEIRNRRRLLMPVLKAAIAQDKRSFLNVDRLIIDKVTYTVDTLHRLPSDLQPQNIATKRSNEAVAFFTEASPLSNFHPCQIKSSNTIHHSSEQSYQYKKADYVGDEVSAHQISIADTPAECKRIGDRVQTDDSEWHTVELDTMRACITTKFTQNPELKKFLLDTGDRALGEASRDRYWGTGVPLLDENALNMGHWAGENHLGKLLMELRDTLR
jgi:ribA/ribD-fused uncharacterized protein